MAVRKDENLVRIHLAPLLDSGWEEALLNPSVDVCVGLKVGVGRSAEAEVLRTRSHLLGGGESGLVGDVNVLQDKLVQAKHGVPLVPDEVEVSPGLVK